MKLIQTPNLPDHDRFYEDLLTHQKDMSDAQVLAFNAQLVMILANHIGENSVLAEALELAAQP